MVSLKELVKRITNSMHLIPYLITDSQIYNLNQDSMSKTMCFSVVNHNEHSAIHIHNLRSVKEESVVAGVT